MDPTNNTIIQEMKTLCAVVCLFACAPVMGAQSTETPGYLERLSKLKTIVDRTTDQITTKASVMKVEDVVNARGKLLAMEKEAHQLQEQSGRSNLTLLQGGKPQDKRLMLIGQGCMSLDAILEALDEYLSTDDRVFLVLLSDYRRSMTTVEKVLWP
jgi:hypothetical protein